MTQTKLAKKGFVASPVDLSNLGKVKRNFTPAEAIELQELQRAMNARKYEAMLVKGNTALVPRGKEVAAELDALATLLDNAKNGYVSQKLLECGYPAGAKVDINLSTGEIIEHADTNDTKTA